jgi:outer membrane protein TolC
MLYQPLAAQSAVVERYVAEGIARNLSLASQRLATQQTAADRAAARGRYLPTIGVESRYSELSGVVNIGDFINPAYDALNQLIGQPRFPTDINATLPFRHQSTLRLTQPVFNTAVGAGRRIADALHGLQGAALRSAIRTLAADIQRAYYGYASAARVVDIWDATLPVLDENLRVSERLLAAGTVTPDVVLRARAERAEARQSLAEARRDRDAARRVVNLLLDRPVDTAVELTDDDAVLPRRTLDDDALVATALQQRDELAQAVAAERATAAQEELATSAFVPSVAFALDYGMQGDQYRFGADNDYTTASIVLQWNLFNGGQNSAQRQRAHLARDRAALQRRAAERAVELEARSAIDAVRVAEQSLRAADERVAAARSAFALTARRFDEGLAPAIEFLSARSTLTTAELNRVLTHYALATRWVELERAAALRPIDQ